MLCEHYFNNYNKSCPICYPSARYKIYPDVYKNNPVAEILRNERPWSSPWDHNFRFGVRKAAMILYFIKEIEQFALSSSPAEVHKTPVRKAPSSDSSDEIYLQSFPCFLKENGEVVMMPFLRLDLVENSIPTTHIGFGQLKATSLVILKDELSGWFQSVDRMYA